jgi:hypothetical protein
LNKPQQLSTTLCPDCEQAILPSAPKFCLDCEQAFIRIIQGPDTISPIEDIQIVDYTRQKAVNIGWFVRHEELREFLEGLKHHRKAFMLNATAMRLVQGRGVATTARIGHIPGMELGPC